jgi:predicted alpha/beta superfamily hydrolase
VCHTLQLGHLQDDSILSPSPEDGAAHAPLCVTRAGYSPIDARQQPYPVLYLNDGQNLFGDCPSLSGSSWNAAHTAAELISSGRLPPFIIVGIDHAGAERSLEYTPCTPGTGPGGFR